MSADYPGNIPNLRGEVDQCSKDRLGIVTDLKIMSWGPIWVGMWLEDAPHWSSNNPRVLSGFVMEWVEWKVNCPPLLISQDPEQLVEKLSHKRITLTGN